MDGRAHVNTHTHRIHAHTFNREYYALPKNHKYVCKYPLEGDRKRESQCEVSKTRRYMHVFITLYVYLCVSVCVCRHLWELPYLCVYSKTSVGPKMPQNSSAHIARKQSKRQKHIKYEIRTGLVSVKFCRLPCELFIYDLSFLWMKFATKQIKSFRGT